MILTSIFLIVVFKYQGLYTSKGAMGNTEVPTCLPFGQVQFSKYLVQYLSVSIVNSRLPVGNNGAALQLNDELKRFLFHRYSLHSTVFKENDCFRLFSFMPLSNLCEQSGVEVKLARWVVFVVKQLCNSSKFNLSRNMFFVSTCSKSSGSQKIRLSGI